MHIEKIAIDEDSCLVQMTVDDIPELVVAINDKHIADNTLTIPFPYTPEDGLQFLNLIDARHAETGHLTNWLIKKSGKVIGGIGLVCQEGFEAHRTELGYWVSSAYRSKGITTLALKTLINYIFDNLHFVRLEAHTFCENIASQKVLEKNGFIKEGLLRCYIEKNGAFKDVYSYSKLHPDLDN